MGINAFDTANVYSNGASEAIFSASWCEFAHTRNIIIITSRISQGIGVITPSASFLVGVPKLRSQSGICGFSYVRYSHDKNIDVCVGRARHQSEQGKLS